MVNTEKENKPNSITASSSKEVEEGKGNDDDAKTKTSDPVNKNEDENNNNNNESNATKKRSKDDDDDDDKNKNKDDKSAKVAKIQTTVIEPMIPTHDPCSPSYDIQTNAHHKKNNGANVMWVIYLALREPSDTKFAQCIEKCKSIAATTGTGELADRLQMDGTRHVTMWEGKMTKKQAAKICFDDDTEIDLPTAIKFDNWIPKGAYLKLDAKSQNKLKDMVSELEYLSVATNARTICDHVSLYRARRMNWQEFNRQCTKIRNNVPASSGQWGQLEGVSIRLKVMGSDYSHCRVLAGV